MMDNDSVVPNDTCFAAHARNQVCCQRKSCRNWLPDKQHCNCVMIAAKEGPKTLQEIGDVFGLTRMRICQIEKGAYKKLHLPVIK